MTITESDNKLVTYRYNSTLFIPFTVVIPTLLCGAETWATKRGQEARLEVKDEDAEMDVRSD